MSAPRPVDQLLPISATPAELALEAATARVELVEQPQRTLNNPATIQANMLPWLAWAFCVPNWDPGWTEEQRRATIATSLAVLKQRGTPGAVKRAISALFRGSEMVEWDQQTPQGVPYTFEMALDVTEDPLERELLFKLIEVVQHTKNLRSHLSAIRVSVSTNAVLSTGAVTGMGIELDLQFSDGSEDLVLDGTWRLDGTYQLTGKR